MNLIYKCIGQNCFRMIQYCINISHLPAVFRLGKLYNSTQGGHRKKYKINDIL